MAPEKQTEAAGAAAETTQAEGGLLDTILEKGLRARDADMRDRGKDLIKEFVAQLLDPRMVVGKNTEKTRQTLTIPPFLIFITPSMMFRILE